MGLYEGSYGAGIVFCSRKRKWARKLGDFVGRAEFFKFQPYFANSDFKSTSLKRKDACRIQVEKKDDVCARMPPPLNAQRKRE